MLVFAENKLSVGSLAQDSLLLQPQGVWSLESGDLGVSGREPGVQEA